MIAPNVMNRSATLNVENHGIEIMSTTAPVRMRSIRLPMAPPVIAARHQSSGFFVRCFFAMIQTTKAKNTTVSATNTQRPPRNILSAIPSFSR